MKKFQKAITMKVFIDSCCNSVSLVLGERQSQLGMGLVRELLLMLCLKCNHSKMYFQDRNQREHSSAICTNLLGTCSCLWKIGMYICVLLKGVGVGREVTQEIKTIFPLSKLNS